MAKKICMENITGSCPNHNKFSDTKLECLYCLREDGKDGMGNQLVESEKATKVFEILKDKIEE